MVFSLPRTLLEYGALKALPAELRSLGVRRPLIVSDRGLAELGLVDRATSLFDRPPPVYADVHPNPVFADADQAAERYREEGCDGLVALGGGSVIDAAKFAAIIARYGGDAAGYIGDSDRIVGRVAPLVAVPTTAGTGSEASPDAGIHPYASSVSVGIRSEWVIPRTSLLDPELTLTLPPHLTAATGLDALSHCIEGYLAIGYAPFADGLALDAIRRICRALPRAVRDGDDRAARRDMMAAAFAGGVGIGKGLGPAHAFAIGCSDQGLHHGVLSALGLLATLDLVCPHVPDRAAALAEAMGLEDGARPSDGVAALMTRVGLPLTLREAGYLGGDLDAFGRAAAASHFNATSPYRPTDAEFRTAIERQLAS